jgi:hypothetical protein
MYRRKGNGCSSNEDSTALRGPGKQSPMLDEG